MLSELETRRLARAMATDLDVDENPAERIAQMIERGQFTAKSVKDLLEQVPEVRHLAVAACVRALGARKWFADLVTKVRTFEPDCKTQVEAAKLIFAYQDGLPPQTMKVEAAKQTEKNVTPEALIEAAKASPAVRAALRELMAIDAT